MAWAWHDAREKMSALGVDVSLSLAGLSLSVCASCGVCAWWGGGRKISRYLSHSSDTAQLSSEGGAPAAGGANSSSLATRAAIVATTVRPAASIGGWPRQTAYVVTLRAPTPVDTQS